MLKQKERDVRKFCLIERYNRILNHISLDVFSSLLLLFGGFNLFLNSLIVINLFPEYFSFKLIYAMWVVCGFSIILLFSSNILNWITVGYLRKNRSKINSIIQEGIKNDSKPSKLKRRQNR